MGIVVFPMTPWHGIGPRAGLAAQHCPEQQLRSPRGALGGILEPCQVWLHPQVLAGLLPGLSRGRTAGS